MHVPALCGYTFGGEVTYMARQPVTYDKMSKKQRKEYDRLKRRGWGGVKPATVTFRDGRGYDRKKMKRELARERDGQAPFSLHVFRAADRNRAHPASSRPGALSAVL